MGRKDEGIGCEGGSGPMEFIPMMMHTVTNYEIIDLEWQEVGD